MSTQTIEAVRKTVTVRAPVEQAWETFTERLGTWWPFVPHSIGHERAETAVIEGRPGGRFLERIEGGEEALWGEVVVWEPPARLVVSWHPGWEPEQATELEVRFTAENGGTRVDLEHRGWERLGEDATGSRAGYESGWDIVLARYVEAAT